MRPCPECGSQIQEDARMCRYCRSQLAGPAAGLGGGAPPSAPSANRPQEGPPKFEVIDVPEPSTARPWEVWVVIALQVLNVAGSLLSGRIMGVIIGILIISGLLKQSNGTWWFVTIVNGLAAVILLVLGASGDRALLVMGLVCAVVAGLMISCRVRGAYSPSMD